MGKLIVVTGANRGIGEAICRAIVDRDQQQTVLYAGSRTGVDLGLRQTPYFQVRYPPLDITDADSVQRLAAQLKDRHPDGIDVLINNAGLNIQQASSDESRQIMAVNFWGTLRVCQALLPLIKPGGRIVNLSSVGSLLNTQYSDEHKERFRKADLRMSDLFQMVAEYEHALKNGTLSEDGWPTSAYCMSKACTNAMTAIMARQYPDLLINCCCPGWVDTDMGRQVGSPSKTPAEGARIPMRLAFDDIGGTSGRYWANKSVSGREAGTVQVW